MTHNWLGDIEHLQRFEPFLDLDSADQLRDYFRFGGLARFQQSPMAGQLAMAEMFSANLAPCIYCGGKRCDKDPAQEHGGTGFIGDTSSWTPQMHKRINGEVRRRGLDADAITSGMDCPVCRCSGWVVVGNKKRSGEEITAKPTGSSKDRDDGGTNNDVILGTCAIVEKILDKADVLFEMTTTVLASCFGPQNYGPISTWHLTPAGKTLLKRNSKDKNETLFFIELRADSDGKGNKILRDQLKAADDQARAAIDAAYRAWNAAYFVDRCGL